MALQPTTVALINKIQTMADADLQVLEQHFDTAYQSFLAIQPPVNGKLPTDTPLLRQAAAASLDADTRAVYQAVVQRRQRLAIQAQQAAYNAKIAAAQVPATAGTPIINTLKTNLGL